VQLYTNVMMVDILVVNQVRHLIQLYVIVEVRFIFDLILKNDLIYVRLYVLLDRFS
jgi:hypothetical protein